MPFHTQALYPAYLDRYFCTAPPQPDAATDAKDALPSWAALEAACAADPRCERFVSPSLHVRAFSPTAILFNVDTSKAGEDGGGGGGGRERILSTIEQGVAIWGAWLQADQAAAAAGAEAAGGNPEKAAAAASGWLLEGAPRQADGLRAALLAEGPALDAAWRRFPRREPSAGAMKKAFGDGAIEEWWASMDGSARL
jgi:hypothetical protein